LSDGKVRGFVFERSTGAAAYGTVAVLEAELDDGLWRPVAALAADHAGYVSFSLDSLKAEQRTQVLGLRVRTGDEAADIPSYASLAAAAPAFVVSVDTHPGGSADLPAIQDPDDVDRTVSPGSFATAPSPLVGDKDCSQLIPAGLASFDYGVYRVVRLGRVDSRTTGEGEPSTPGRGSPLLSGLAALVSGGPAGGRVDVGTRLQELTAAATRVQLGVVLRFAQRWQSIGQCLGDIVYSLPLAPGEARDLALIDWSRSDSVSRIDDIDSSEQLLHNQHRDRNIEEAVNAGLHEHQEGWSFMAGTAGAASASIPIEKVNLSISADHAIGVGIASTTGDRNLSGFSQQDLADTVTQATTVVRALRSTVIVQADQNEANTVQTRTIANHNRCHALTMQYYEVLRAYRVTTSLAGATLALLVPHALVTFDAAAALRWRAALERNLLDPALASCFDALAHLQRCADTAYEKDGPTSTSTPTPTPTPTPTYAATSFTVRLDTGPRETWGSIWVNLVASDGTRSCVFFKANVPGLGPSNAEEADLVLAINSVRTWVVSANSDQVDGIGLDLRTIESIEVEWVEANGNDAWAYAGISVTATADGNAAPILINGLKYFGTRPYIQKFDNSGHTHQVWSAPAKMDPAAIPKPTNGTTPPTGPTPRPEPTGRNRAADRCCTEMLLGHLNDNAAFYSRVVWVGMDSTERRIRLVNALGPQVADAVDDLPLAVGGNQVAFQLNAVEPDDPRLTALIGTPKPTVRYATMPARGVFAEAELGRCNACERRDATRMTEWSPVRPPQIGSVTPGPRGTTPELQPTSLPGPVVQVVQAPSAPDPSGLGAALTLLGQPNIFRDMSGRAELEHLLSGLVSGAVSLTEAQILASKVKEKQAAAAPDGSGIGGKPAPGAPTRTPAAESDAGHQVDRLDIIDQARTSGLISDSDARGAALGVVGGEPSPGVSGDLVQQAGVNIEDAREWEDLIRFRPPDAILKELAQRGMRWQNYESAMGPDINLDRYPVLIRRMPRQSGKELSAEELLRQIRLGMSGLNPVFVDPDLSTFVPYEESDATRWAAVDPLGSVIYINIKGPDDAAVVTSAASTRHWRFSTIETKKSGQHPVTGNREWRIDRLQGGEHIFMTRGADRTSGFFESQILVGRGMAWAGGHALWISLQQRLTAWINAHDGVAELQEPHHNAYRWILVRALLRLSETQEL
jgi:hypothetical protein